MTYNAPSRPLYGARVGAGSACDLGGTAARSAPGFGSQNSYAPRWGGLAAWAGEL
jgi:hypothetical protein